MTPALHPSQGRPYSVENTKMEQQKRVVDLSAYFLVEAMGDSEGDFDPRKEEAFLDVGGVGGVAVNDDDDDAESCSYDVCCINIHGVNDSVINGGCVHCHDDGDADGDDDENKEEEDGIDTMCMNGTHIERGDHNQHEDRASEIRSTAGSHSWRNVVDSRKEKMSEVEKNRLFWETCLAS